MRVCHGLLGIILSLLLFQVTESGALTPPAAPKSFAVFSVHYNENGGEARGGVCGTVFFISPHRAVTAHHVVNAATFKPQKGFSRVRIWLVHEGYAPLEIKPRFIVSDRLKDITVITLPPQLRVAEKFVFQTAEIHEFKGRVTSEGFLANTLGPILKRVGKDVVILSVPFLTRLFAEGEILRGAKVNLKAADLELKNSPHIQLGYKPVVGMSGGPVIANGRVIAMNSFADPTTFQQTWALQLRPGMQTLALP